MTDGDEGRGDGGVLALLVVPVCVPARSDAMGDGFNPSDADGRSQRARLAERGMKVINPAAAAWPCNVMGDQ